MLSKYNPDTWTMIVLIILLGISPIPAYADVDEVCEILKPDSHVFANSLTDTERLLTETNCLLRYIAKQGERE